MNIEVIAKEFIKCNGQWDEWLFDKAVEHGNLEVMKWLRENGCPWHTNTFTTGIIYGNLDVLNWLHENDCPWNKNTFGAAVAMGNLDILNWLHEKGYSWDKDSIEFHMTTTLNKNVIPWLVENKYIDLKE